MDGKKLRALRDRAVLSQEGLAKAAGVNQRTIGAIERGDYSNARPVTIRKLADALGVQPGDLLGDVS